MFSRVHEFDLRVDALVERIRGPQLDPVFYGLSSAADHGLLWLLVGATRAAREGDPGSGAAPGCGARRRVDPHQRPDQGVLPPGPPRRRPPAGGPAPLRHAPADLELVPVGPRGVGVHRRDAARRGPGHAGVVRARRRRSPPAGCTRRCTTPATSSPAPRSGVVLGAIARRVVRSADTPIADLRVGYR